MKNNNTIKMGVMFRRDHPPELLPGFAQKAEELGYDEIWVVEDCFYGSGIATAASALAATRSIDVGVGILPAVVRNPVFTAMEIATLARIYPTRFLPGLGHGVASWMDQIGALPKSQLTALEEVTVIVRELLEGKRLNFDGSYTRLEESELVFPPEQVPPISLGVRGPKSLALSGKVADGTILAELAAPAYVSWARTQIEKGQLSGEGREHRLTVFVFVSPGQSKSGSIARARPHIGPIIASGKIDAQLSPMGILPLVEDLRTKYEQDLLSEKIPSEWIEQLVLVGTRTDWEGSIQQFTDAGADALVLVPLPDAELGEFELIAEQLTLS